MWVQLFLGCGGYQSMKIFDDAVQTYHIDPLVKYCNAFRNLIVCWNMAHLVSNWLHTEYSEGSVHPKRSISYTFCGHLFLKTSCARSWACRVYAATGRVKWVFSMSQKEMRKEYDRLVMTSFSPSMICVDYTIAALSVGLLELELSWGDISICFYSAHKSNETQCNSSTSMFCNVTDCRAYVMHALSYNCHGWCSTTFLWFLAHALQSCIKMECSEGYYELLDMMFLRLRFRIRIMKRWSSSLLH